MHASSEGTSIVVNRSCLNSFVGVNVLYFSGYKKELIYYNMIYLTNEYDMEE